MSPRKVVEGVVSPAASISIGLQQVRSELRGKWFSCVREIGVNPATMTATFPLRVVRGRATL
jgi:hypothetical protein